MKTEVQNPIHALQRQEEERLSIAVDILKNARNELYFAMRFLDVALSSLGFVPDPSNPSLGTDGANLYFSPDWLLPAFENGRVTVNRLYLHEVFHCLFCHLWHGEKRDPRLWNLACDIAVESILDELYYPAVYRRPKSFRRESYKRLRENRKVLTAEGIYHDLENEKDEEALSRLEAEFRRDDHSRWSFSSTKNPTPNRQKEWEELREKMQTEMETLSKEAAGEAQSLLTELRAENRERYDYREFLRKFSVLKEEMKVDADSFDYIFYSYGLKLYGNMPLIEPLETKEMKRIEDFVIVIDTSMSCKGELVKHFLEETYGVLSESESFFRKINVHIIQCDDRIQEDRVIHDNQEMEQYLKHFTVKGLGGTDFRPAFTYVAGLLEAGAFTHLKGLIYFTDGYGLFPVKMPPYDTAFVFMREDYRDVDVPPWAIKLIIDTDTWKEEIREYEY